MEPMTGALRLGTDGPAAGAGAMEVSEQAALDAAGGSLSAGVPGLAGSFVPAAAAADGAVTGLAGAAENVAAVATTAADNAVADGIIQAGEQAGAEGVVNAGSISLPFAPESQGAFQLTARFENVPPSMWEDFPVGVPRPTGPLNLLEGDAYAAARQAANQANRQLSQGFGLGPAGYDVHEITPIKFGGSPIDLANKIGLPRDLHRTVTAWFSDLQRLMGGD